MDSEDFINVPALSNSSGENENSELHSSKGEPAEADTQRCSSSCREEKLIDDYHLHKEADAGHGDNDCTMEIELDKDSVANLSIAHVSVGLTETVSIAGGINGFTSEVHADNCRLTTQDETSFGDHKKAGSSILGVKRARVTFEEQESSVHVMYHSLTRASKLKLQELLQEWSEWHAHHDSSSLDPIGELELGEETHFPALNVGEKSSAVSFWLDNRTSTQSKEFVPSDSKSVPLYDRGYALGLTATDGLNNLEGGLIVADASRCFNCGSYSHALKDCPRPRDNIAVSNARKQHNSKRNQNPGSRNPTRYYQNSPGGKYDGLKPGTLDPETRKLLGLGELDPPPWLNRMREIGYPPGYLDNESQPSGITIYGDEEVKDEREEGEITEAEQQSEPPKEMTVEFPGINASIPLNANERLWASTSDQFRSQSVRRSNYYSEPSSRGYLSSSSYPPRYESPVHSYSSRGITAHGRSFSERRSPNRHDHGSARFDDSQRDSEHDPNSSYHNRHSHDMHRSNSSRLR